MSRPLCLAAAVAALAAAAPAQAATPQPAEPLAAQALAGILGLPSQSGDAAAAELAKLLISQFDADGDGQLNASEAASALGRTGRAITSTDLSAAISRLDTDGDGKLSAAELAAGLEQELAPSNRSASHHHHHRRGVKLGLAH